MTKDELLQLTIQAPSKEAYDKVCQNWDGIAKPIDGLGDFETLLARIGAMKGNSIFSLKKKAHVIMCADNGVVCEGVSQSGQEITRAVTSLMGQGKSSIGAMASAMGKDSKPEFFVYDVGVMGTEPMPGVIDEKIAQGTGNILTTEAMTEKECLSAIAVGMEAVRKRKDEGYEIISTGEMGIGNTTTSTALLAALTDYSATELTGRGAGLSDAGLARKTEVISMALRFHKLDEHKIQTSEHALTALQKVGGLDLAALVGVFLGGAYYQVPIVIDGVISAVAALVAERICPGAKEYFIASHEGREQGVGKVLSLLGLKPYIKGDLALGEGTGAIMLYPLLDMAMALYGTGTAFAQTDIAQYERYSS